MHISNFSNNYPNRQSFGAITKIEFADKFNPTDNKEERDMVDRFLDSDAIINFAKKYNFKAEFAMVPYENHVAHKLTLIPDVVKPSKNGKTQHKDGLFKKISNALKHKDHLEIANDKLAKLDQDANVETLPVKFVAIRSYGKTSEQSSRGFYTGLKLLTEDELVREMKKTQETKTIANA